MNRIENKMEADVEVIQGKGFRRYRARCPICGYLNVLTTYYSLIDFFATRHTARTCRHFGGIPLIKPLKAIFRKKP